MDKLAIRKNKHSRSSSNPCSRFSLCSSISKEKLRFKTNYLYRNEHKPSESINSDERIQSKEFLAVWDELRQKKQLFDGSIRSSEGTVFQIHRAILATFSPYFKAYFTNTINLERTEKYELHLRDISSEVINHILDFAYTGQCIINRSNVEKLLPAADQLECISVVKKCSEFIIGELCPENCLGILRFAKCYSCEFLENETKNFIRWNCVEIFKSPEFEELSWEEVYDILSDDSLNVPREEIVYEAVDRWISKSPKERGKFLYILFQCIRFGLMDIKYLREVVKTNNYMNEDTREFLCTVEVESIYGFNCSKAFMRPRIPFEVIFAVGGWSKGHPTTVIETYDPRAERWFIIDYEDMVPRAYHVLACLDNQIYMIGGYDGNVYYNTVRCFDPVTRRWTQRACMSYPRCYASVAVHNGEIYVMGGFNGRDRMHFVEKYNPHQNAWKMIKSMNSPRSDASAATYNDKIYIVGGFNGAEVLMTCEVYDPSTGQWTFIPCMSTPRSGVNLIVYKECLYAIGGYDGAERLNKVEKYSQEAELWQPVREMLFARSNFACIVHEDRIFVIGGFNGTTTMCETEFYNGETDEWQMGKQMNIHRSALSACICRGLPNSYDYSLAGVSKPSPNKSRSSST
ncbi:kelch-like protein 10 [Nilaparvata lugens]|uniref:kelch-like protein 10 n=1 Tax=Nilaparvata lugens TaxID=108931 RepID=UPI00193DD030|nr:kelch-like protein 10 [Nilaparvata lugens]